MNVHKTFNLRLVSTVLFQQNVGDDLGVYVLHKALLILSVFSFPSLKNFLKKLNMSF